MFFFAAERAFGARSLREVYLLALQAYLFRLATHFAARQFHAWNMVAVLLPQLG